MLQPARQEMLIAGSIAVAGLCAGALWGIRVHAQSPRHPLLIQTIVEHPESGSMKTFAYITEAVRSDGSSMMDTLLVEDAGKPPTRGLILVPEKIHVEWDPAANLVRSTPLTPRQLSRAVSPVAPDCLASHCAPSDQTVLGYKTMKLTREFHEQNGARVRIDEYVAPELGYRTLRFESSRDGVLLERRSAAYVAQGEPALGLFAIPR